MAIQHFKEGLDPTGVTCITTAMLLQMIRNAQPYPNQGLIIWSPTAPDVVTNPELSTFFWGYQSDLADPSTRTKQIYFYNGTSWELIPLELLNGDVTLDKINLTGANIFDILQVIAGPTLAWVSIVNAIQNNTLPLGKLLAPDNTNKYLLTCLLGAKAFTKLADFFGTVLDDEIIPISKLVPGAADPLKKWLSTRADGSATEWDEIDINNLTGAGLTANQVLRRNSTDTAWDGYIPGLVMVSPIALHTFTDIAAWTTLNLDSHGVPNTAKAILLYIAAWADQVGPAPNSVQYFTQIRGNGIVYDTINAIGGGLYGTPVSLPARGQFFVAPDISGSTVSIDVQIQKITTGGVVETLSETIQLIGYVL